MEHGQLRFAGGFGMAIGKQAGILVVYMDEIDALKHSKGREPQSFPME